MGTVDLPASSRRSSAGSVTSTRSLAGGKSEGAGAGTPRRLSLAPEDALRVFDEQQLIQQQHQNTRSGSRRGSRHRKRKVRMSSQDEEEEVAPAAMEFAPLDGSEAQ